MVLFINKITKKYPRTAISRIHLLIAVLYACTVPSKAQNPKAEALLSKAFENVQGLNSGHIEFLFNAKKRLDIDTREKDTITKYGFFDFAYSSDTSSPKIAAYILSIKGVKTYLYFNDSCYTINPSDSTIKREYRTKRLLWPLSVNGLTLVEATVEGGERINKLKERTTDTGFFTTFLPDSTLNNNQVCYAIQILKNDSDVEEKELYTPSYHKKLYIAKADSFLLKEYHTHIDFGFRFYWNEQITRYKPNYYTAKEIEDEAKKLLASYRAQGYTYFNENDNNNKPVEKNQKKPQLPVPNVGDASPNFRLANYYAPYDTTELYKVQANYILLDFWYASCAPCLQDIPKIKSYASAYHREELSIYGINVYDHDTSRIGAIDSKFHFNYPILINGRELAEKDYGQNAFPLKVLLDSEKKIIYIGKGHSLKEGPTELDLLLKKLLGH